MKQFVSIFYMLSAFTMAFLASGCGEREALSIPEKETVKEEPKLVLLNWEEYIAPEVLLRFTQETGIRVDVEEFGSNEQLEARMQEDLSTIDLAVVDDSVLKTYVSLKLIQPLDHSKVPNLGNIHLLARSLETRVQGEDRADR